MAKAKAEITISRIIDIANTTRYYLLQSSTADAPTKPTTYPPASMWGDTEPTYTQGSTNSLYVVDCTVYSNGEFDYSPVSLSTSYEAAKAAYNKAQNAQNAADTANNALVNWCHENDMTLINGAKIYTDSITADKISVTSLETICAKIGGFTIGDSALHNGISALTSSGDGVYVGTDGIRCGPDFIARKNGVMSSKTANLQNVNVFDSITFLASSGRDICGSSSTEFEAIGNFSISDEDSGYMWDSGMEVLGRCLEYNAMSRFNNAVSMLGLYVDNNITIGRDLVVNGTTEFGKLEGVSSTGARTGSIVIGNMAIVFGTVSITTGTSALDGLYSGLVDISFGVTFKQAPAIITNWAGNYANMHSTGAFSADTTGATVWGRLVNPSSTRTIQWVAIGEIA